MQRDRVEKLRLLVQDIRKEKLCLQDIIDKAINLSKPACTLEIENSPKALEDLKRGAKEIRDLGALFYRRLCDEVQPEVIAHSQSKPKGKPRGVDIRENLKNKEQE